MATQLKKTVKPSGGDYTSLEACLNDNEQNLVTADKYFDVEISGEWSSADTTAVTIHNYTTDSTRYINIYATGDAKHSGKVGTGYTLKNTLLISFVPYTRITDLILEPTGNVTDIATGGVCFRNSANSVVNRCVIKSVGHGVACAYGAIKVANSVIYRATREYFSRGVDDLSNYATIVYNCIIWNYDYPTRGSGNYVKNCFEFYTGIETRASFGCSSDNSSNNATSRESESAIFTLTELTVADEIEDYANGDARLKSTSNLINAGVDLGSDYNTDIIGTSRPQGDAWDIGAFEYVSAVSKRRLLMGVGI